MSLAGQCDLTTAPQLAAALADLPTGHPRLFLDLSGLAFIDAASVPVLLDTRNRLEGHGVRVIVAAAQPVAVRVLELTGADRLITMTSRLPD